MSIADEFPTADEMYRNTKNGIANRIEPTLEKIMKKLGCAKEDGDYTAELIIPCAHYTDTIEFLGSKGYTAHSFDNYEEPEDGLCWIRISWEDREEV